MKESKLIKLLRKLDRAEIKHLTDFVNSPYYNKNKNHSKVFEELVKYHPDFNPESFSEEKIHKRVFNSGKYDYFAMKNILSDLHELTLKFLVIETHRVAEIKIKTEIDLLETLRIKEAFDEYKSRLKKVKRKIDNEKTSDEFLIREKYRFTGEQISYYSILEPNSRFELKQEELDQLVYLFLIKILKANTMLRHELVQNNYPFKFTMFDEVIKFLENNTFEDEPILMLYKNILLLQSTNNYKYYLNLIEIRDKYRHLFNKGDLYTLHIHMRTHCVVNYNVHQNEKYLYDCFKLNKYHSDLGELTLGKILYPDFIAYVKAAVAVKEFDWAEKFIKENKDELSDDVKPDVLNFSYGLVAYMKGDLQEAMELIYKVSFNIFIMQVQVYIMLARIYYEIGYHEETLNLTRTAKEYLKKEGIAPGDMQTTLKEFFNYTVSMAKLRLSLEDKEDFNFKLSKLKEKIEGMKFNYFGVKLWLDKEIGNVKKKTNPAY